MEVYTKKIYLNKNNKPMRIIDENGKIIDLEYDSRGNIIRDENGRYYAYDQNNNIIYDTHSTYVYSGKLKILEISGSIVEKYEYDKYGNIIYMRTYGYKNNYCYEYKYDIRGYIIEKEVYDEETVDDYDENGDYYSSHKEFKYNYSELYNYDENGRLITITDKDSDSEYSLYHEYKYDENGNKIYFYDAWNEIKYFFEYDENGNNIYYKIIDLPDDISIIRYEYNQDNNIIKEIREGDGTTPEDNIIINYEYYDESEI